MNNNFKFIAVALLACSTLILCGGCDKIKNAINQVQGENTEMADTTETTQTVTSVPEPEEAPEPLLTEEEVKVLVMDLWNGIPDHGMNGMTSESLSPAFYELVDMGFSVPSDNPGGIGSEETMYYWYTGQDTGYDAGVRDVKAKKISQNEVIANVSYYDGFGDRQNHVVTLRKITDPANNVYNKWLIDDFDNRRAAIYEYVNTIGKKFTKGYGRTVLDDPEIGGYMSDYQKQVYLSEIDRFGDKFKQHYPDGNVKK